MHEPHSKRCGSQVNPAHFKIKRVQADECGFSALVFVYTHLSIYVVIAQTAETWWSHWSKPLEMFHMQTAAGVICMVCGSHTDSGPHQFCASVNRGKGQGTIFMLSNQHVDMPHLWGGMDYLGKGEVLTKTDLDPYPDNYHYFFTNQYVIQNKALKPHFPNKQITSQWLHLGTSYQFFHPLLKPCGFSKTGLVN